MRKTFVYLIVWLLFACDDSVRPQPRPHQYPKVEFPKRSLQNFKSEDCPFSFELPIYATIEKKELLFDEVKANPCWFDIVIELFDASIHCSYYKIDQDHTLERLVNDAYTMASKHNVKASHREEYELKNKSGSAGIAFKILGPVATPYQFYITDSTEHFLRGSLYFNSKMDRDSLLPMITFLEEDIDVMINTIDWY